LDFQNILIFRIGHLGDTVVALPALWALRRSFPSSRLTLLTNLDKRNPHYVSPASVLPAKGLVDDFIAYPTNLAIPGRAAAFLQLARDIRRRRFDSVIYLMPRMRSRQQVARDKMFFRLCGLLDLRGSEFLLNNRLDLPMPGQSQRIESESNFLLRLLADIGIVAKTSETDLLLTENEVAAAKHSLGVAEIARADAKFIAVGPGAKWESKMWSEDRYGEVVAELVHKYDCHPIVFGGKEDVEKGERMIRKWGRGSNAAGLLTVRESAAILGECLHYVGNDTGTMHLAAAMGTPCVAIFSAIDWIGKWEPFGENNRIFRSAFECKGCDLGKCVNQKQCLELIEMDDVFRACCEIIEGIDEVDYLVN
jgi:ADP-heptose:LPS heptosyltransferase